MVVGDGFEPPNPKEQIYSLPRLASSLPNHVCKTMTLGHSAFLFYHLLFSLSTTIFLFYNFFYIFNIKSKKGIFYPYL